MGEEKLGRIQTMIKCPNCDTELDFSHIKDAIKEQDEKSRLADSKMLIVKSQEDNLEQKVREYEVKLSELNLKEEAVSSEIDRARGLIKQADVAEAKGASMSIHLKDSKESLSQKQREVAEAMSQNEAKLKEVIAEKEVIAKAKAEAKKAEALADAKTLDAIAKGKEADATLAEANEQLLQSQYLMVQVNKYAEKYKIKKALGLE